MISKRFQKITAKFLEECAGSQKSCRGYATQFVLTQHLGWKAYEYITIWLFHPGDSTDVQNLDIVIITWQNIVISNLKIPAQHQHWFPDLMHAPFSKYIAILLGRVHVPQYRDWSKKISNILGNTSSQGGAWQTVSWFHGIRAFVYICRDVSTIWQHTKY